MKKGLGSLRACLLVLLGASALSAQLGEEYYRVENVATPPNHSPEVSAITFDGKGRLYAALRLGTIWEQQKGARNLFDKKGSWHLFASGLHWPLGMLPGKRGEVFVVQLPELTRIVDEDGDGRADLYETICDDWGLGGNYHEFVAGPVRDARGNFYVALGCSSSGGPLRPPFRGRATSKPRKGKIYGHHSPVPWRGWIVKISPDGRLEPFASGFRQPNGIVLSADGELFAVDNQGDWVGTSPLHHVEKGAFHGHPASLVWDPALKEHPQDLTVQRLDARRKKPAILFPQNDLAGSVSSPVFDTTEGRFGPFTGQLFVADWSHARIHRVALERIDGVYQGACFPFLDGGSLRRGNQRLGWSPDGALFVAQVSRLWGGAGEGLQKVTWTGKMPLEIRSMHLESRGFRLEFTRRVSAETVLASSAISVSRYRYSYHGKYGSPKVDVKPVGIESVVLRSNERTLDVVLDRVEAGFLYDFRFRAIRSVDGAPLSSRLAAYTVNKLPR